MLIIQEEIEVIKAFEKEFSKLIEVLKPLQTIAPLTKFEVEENNLLRNRDYLANDLIYQAKATNRPEIVRTAFEIAPQNLSIQKTANDLGLIKKLKLKFSVWISIVNDGVKLIASKDAPIPATFTTIARTTKDNQTKCSTDIVWGEANKASLNNKLVNLTLDEIPQKQAGKVEVKISFSIDLNGNSRLEMMSLDTGKKVHYSKNVIWLIE